jgi:flagellar basal-body rod protein FlgB
MTIQDIGLFQAIGSKIGYLNQRQSIISQNIANSDTPGYRPKDLVEVDFGQMVKKASEGGVKNVSIARTNEGHMTGGNDPIDPKSRKQRDMYEVAPAGNSVIIEEQLMDAGQNAADYNLMLNIMQKQVGMIRTALGN